MFTTYFQFDTHPFGEKIPVSNIINDERFAQAMARLQYFTIDGNVALIVGGTGVGKSTLIRLFLSKLPKKQYMPVYIHFTHVRSAGIFHQIVKELGEDPKRSKENLFLQVMETAHKINRTICIIIDEAHHLDNNALTDLRLLTSSALEDAPPMKIIFMGQHGIKDKIKKGAHTDLAHRISVYYHLKPLTKIQTHSYIDFRMKYGGSKENVFESEVKDSIHMYSRGIPRQINNIATACLINGSVQKKQKIDLPLLNQTMAEVDFI